MKQSSIKKTALAAALSFVLAGNINAQQPLQNSTICNPDGTVTFLYQNDKCPWMCNLPADTP